MVGSDDFHASRMCAVDDLGYNRVAGKDLYVNEIDIAGLSCLDVQLCVFFRLDGFLAALFGGTEGHQNRSLAENGTQFL